MKHTTMIYRLVGGLLTLMSLLMALVAMTVFWPRGWPAGVASLIVLCAYRLADPEVFATMVRPLRDFGEGIRDGLGSDRTFNDKHV